MYKHILLPLPVTSLLADQYTRLCPVAGEHPPLLELFSTQSLSHSTCCN